MICALVALAAPPPAASQIPREFQNLQVLPADIDPDSLVQLMRSFSFATGLRCEDCHVMGEGGSFQGARFDLDDKENKAKARVMLRMVEAINEDLLGALPERREPPVAVECKTCHRGLRTPYLLRTELHRVVASQGIDAAVARYRELRESRMEMGAYDFREWEMNELGRELEGGGDLEAAAAMYELNEEYHPESASIPLALGRLYERMERPDRALAAYRRVLERSPDHAFARARVEALSGG
jgi:tetratricopeptide (TPR) repeat protein